VKQLEVEGGGSMCPCSALQLATPTFFYAPSCIVHAADPADNPVVVWL